MPDLGTECTLSCYEITDLEYNPLTITKAKSAWEQEITGLTSLETPSWPGCCTSVWQLAGREASMALFTEGHPQAI